MTDADVTVTEPDHPEVRAFWDVARMHAKLNAAPSYFGPTPLESVPPPAWSYGDTPAEADDFVATALTDEGGATSAPLGDYDGMLPEEGVLSILCDGEGRPRALIETTTVEVSGDDVREHFRVVYRGD
ncbi:ASCH domain-containing protein [Nocardioides sediminis]|uniref:ASCH domain-containing protein n=1 Tax=Nocardioides sediminis TaxID=433648 RepID=UPI000D310D70|nr:ASCH domain-containing protein [Nocardioides sediminis]